MDFANYQQQIRNKYTEDVAQAQEPSRDRGLWSVLGRAIRSTVPTRANEGYNPNVPASDTNTPYVKPGFFRAMLGDRGADLNTAAMLQGRDLKQGLDMANTQAGYGNEQRGLETKAVNDRELFAGGIREKIERIRADNAMNRDAARNWMGLGQIGQKAKFDQERDTARFGNAKTLRGIPQALDPSVVRMNEQRGNAAEKNATRPTLIEQIQKLKELQPATSEDSLSPWASFLNTLKGPNASQPQLPQTPQTGPTTTQAPANPNTPSVIKIDPNDLRTLGIGAGAGLLNQIPDDEEDDLLTPLYGDGE